MPTTARTHIITVTIRRTLKSARFYMYNSARCFSCRRHYIACNDFKEAGLKRGVAPRSLLAECSYAGSPLYTDLISVSRSLIVVAMAATKCRRWVLKTRSEGIPKQSDFEIVEEELPPLKDGGKFLNSFTACQAQLVS